MRTYSFQCESRLSMTEYLHHKGVIHREPGYQRIQYSYQQRGRTQAGRLWAGTILSEAQASRLHQPSHNPVVSTSRTPLWGYCLWARSRYVERWVCHSSFFSRIQLKLITDALCWNYLQRNPSFKEVTRFTNSK